jgi:hypothetical protein
MFNANDRLFRAAHAFCIEVMGWPHAGRPEVASHILLMTGGDGLHTMFMFKYPGAVLPKVQEAFGRLPLYQREELRYAIAEAVGDWLDAGEERMDALLAEAMEATVKAYREAGMTPAAPTIDKRSAVR